MNIQLSDECEQRFPLLFIAPEHRGSVDAKPNAIIEVESGWRTLLIALFGSIYTRHRKTLSLPYILQVKEKYGRLVVLYGNDVNYEGDDLDESAIRMTEMLSETMCEFCGRPANVYYKNGISKTMCAEHILSVFGNTK